MSLPARIRLWFSARAEMPASAWAAATGRGQQAGDASSGLCGPRFSKALHPVRLMQLSDHPTWMCITREVQKHVLAGKRSDSPVCSTRNYCLKPHVRRAVTAGRVGGAPAPPRRCGYSRTSAVPWVAIKGAMLFFCWWRSLPSICKKHSICEVQRSQMQ